MGQKKSYEGKFWKFALPSMLSQLLNSLFIIVDGFYVGQNMGDAGLAAINVVWPMVALIQAVSMAIGTGGAVIIAINVGRQDYETAKKAQNDSLFMLAIAFVLFGLGFYVTYPYILPHLGANQELYPLAADYIKVVCIFTSFQVMTTGALPLLRGAGKTIEAMSLTILGLLGNIFLDWLYIDKYHWGMTGAALATALSQGICAVPCLLILMHRKSPKVSMWPLKPKRMLAIGYYGFSAFGLTISSSVLILMGNLQALKYGGTQGVAVYAILSYVLGSVIPLVSGVGEGIQPLLGNAYGAYDWQAIEKLRKKGLTLAVATALACSLVCWMFRGQVPVLFGASPAAAKEGMGAMWTIVVAFPLVALVRFSCSYFCALGMPRASSILAYGEPLVAQPMFLYLLPVFWNLEGVWISYPTALLLMTVVVFCLLGIHRKKHSEEI